MVKEFSKTRQPLDSRFAGQARSLLDTFSFQEVPWLYRALSLAGLFYSQQLRPQYIRVPGWQRHANGAGGIRSVTVAAETPAEYASYQASPTEKLTHSG